ncbi:MAG: nitrous oxide reductase family maturation protein NosD, partial [Candidatus Altarchaeaceae archaeon]
PIYYWTNEKNALNNCKDAEINESSNAGFVALVSCDNITVKNLNLENNSHGILLVNTNNSKILSNNASSNWNGIHLYASSNNTLTENNVSSNGGGIYLDSSSDNTLTENNVSSNGGGIYLDSSSNNTLTGNNVSSNNYGLYVSSDSSSNTINSNTFCSNNNYDIYDDDATTGDNNTCDETYNYDDTGKNGCTSSCSGIPGVCYCSSCEECTNKLSYSSCTEVILTTDIIDHWGTCIDNPQNFNNKIFDCQGHTIDGVWWWGYYGYGIYLYGKQNNTIRNCIITNFYRGIYLSSSSNNTLINNTMNNNRYNFYISGEEISHYYQDIDTSNTVNGKPVYYWTNEKNAPNNCKDA